MSSDIRREAEDLARYHGELLRRLAQAGVRDVAEIMALYEHLRRALGAVSSQEIAWAAEQADRLAAALEQHRADLARLARVRAAVDACLDGRAPVRTEGEPGA
jgi:hypothetical protein